MNASMAAQAGRWITCGSAAAVSALLLLSGPAHAAKAPAPLHVYGIRSPTHNLYCDVGDEDQVHCLSRKQPASAILSHNGKVKRCSGARCVRNQRLFTAPIPVLKYGQRDIKGPYTCTSLMSGMRCVLTKGPGRGKGFLISSTGVRRIRPAAVAADAPPPLHRTVFQTPGRTIGCMIYAPFVLLDKDAKESDFVVVCEALKGHAREASIAESGKRIRLCNKAHFDNVCSILYPRGPALLYGQSTEAHGFRCRSASTGITCTMLAGSHEGEGFRINQHEAVRVG